MTNLRLCRVNSVACFSIRISNSSTLNLNRIPHTYTDIMREDSKNANEYIEKKM